MLLHAEPTTREGSHPGTLRTLSKMDDYVDAYVAGQRYAQVPLELQFKGAPTGETLRPDAGDFGNASMCIRRQSCSTSYIVTTSGELSSADDDGNCLREDCINVSSRNDGLEAAEHGQDFVVCATRTDGEQESTSRLENNHSTRRRNEDSTAEGIIAAGVDTVMQGATIVADGVDTVTQGETIVEARATTTSTGIGVSQPGATMYEGDSCTRANAGDLRDLRAKQPAVTAEEDAAIAPSPSNRPPPDLPPLSQQPRTPSPRGYTTTR